MFSVFVWLIGIAIIGHIDRSGLFYLIWFFAGIPLSSIVILCLIVWLTIDDFNSVWGGSGPDCCTVQREAAPNITVPSQAKSL